MKRLVGGRPVNWHWIDETILNKAWHTGQSTSGHSYVGYADARAPLRVLPISYDLAGNNLVVSVENLQFST